MVVIIDDSDDEEAGPPSQYAPASHGHWPVVTIPDSQDPEGTDTIVIQDSQPHPADKKQWSDDYALCGRPAEALISVDDSVVSYFLEVGDWRGRTASSQGGLRRRRHAWPLDGGASVLSTSCLGDESGVAFPVRHSVLCDLGGAMGGPAKQFLANRAKELSLPHGLLAVQNLSQSITYPAEVVAKGEAWAIDPYWRVSGDD